MKIHKTTLKNTLPPDFNPANAGTPLLFDIETTGLTPDLSAIFMIGCGYIAGDRLEVIQWLSDSTELCGELEVLRAFSDWLESREAPDSSFHLITYNGHNFDLPFLQSRCDQCGIRNPLSAAGLTKNAADLYRFVRNYKPLWPVPDLKLKSMASWLGGGAASAPEGRRLIRAYHDYIRTKDSKYLELLFLHNTQDLSSLNLIRILCNYSAFFNGAFRIAGTGVFKKDIFEFIMTPEVCLPKSLSYEAFDFHMDMTPSEVRILAPVCQGKLRYYHEDFKNYVYLPEEDYVIPKSMASYIERKHWIKTSRENCYKWFSLDHNFMNRTENQKNYLSMIFRLFGFSG